MTTTPAAIMAEDRRIAGVWADDGEVPDDRGARVHAATLCARFLAVYDALVESLDELIVKANAYDAVLAEEERACVSAPIAGQAELFEEVAR